MTDEKENLVKTNLVAVSLGMDEGKKSAGENKTNSKTNGFIQFADIS